MGKDAYLISAHLSSCFRPRTAAFLMVRDSAVAARSPADGYPAWAASGLGVCAADVGCRWDTRWQAAAMAPSKVVPTCPGQGRGWRSSEGDAFSHGWAGFPKRGARRGYFSLTCWFVCCFIHSFFHLLFIHIFKEQCSVATRCTDLEGRLEGHVQRLQVLAVRLLGVT